MRVRLGPFSVSASLFPQSGPVAAATRFAATGGNPTFRWQRRALGVIRIESRSILYVWIKPKTSSARTSAIASPATCENGTASQPTCPGQDRKFVIERGIDYG